MKFSIITPTYNSEKFLKETIESVIYQEGDFEVEYVIVDGASKDNTISIIKKYESLVSSSVFKPKCKKVTLSWLSEKDFGMYDAINKGFAKSSGEICAWINADDTYTSKAFELIKESFTNFPQIEWLKGKTIFVEETGKPIYTAPCFVFNKKWIQDGIYGRNAYFINQDSVFWRKTLLEKVGQIDSKLRYAGDYALWVKFAQFAELWSLDVAVSTFREHGGQLSNNESAYRKEQSEISPIKGFSHYPIKVFFWLKTVLGKNLEWIFIYLYPLLFLNRKREYVAIEKDELVIKKAHSYII